MGILLKNPNKPEKLAEMILKMIDCGPKNVHFEHYVNFLKKSESDSFTHSLMIAIRYLMNRFREK